MGGDFVTTRIVEKCELGREHTLYIDRLLHTVWLGLGVSVLEFGDGSVQRSDDTQHLCDSLLQKNMIPLHGSSHS